jgi:hypothetical protein
MIEEIGRRLRQETRGVPAPPARLAGLIDLGGGVAFKVESTALTAIRGRLADAFAGTLTPQDARGWRPHVAVQNKVSPTVARGTRAELEAGFTPRPLAIVGLASWFYRGGPGEAIGRFSFG